MLPLFLPKRSIYLPISYIKHNCHLLCQIVPYLKRVRFKYEIGRKGQEDN